MNMNEVLSINSIPFLESELKSVQENLFKINNMEEAVRLFQKEMMIRVRIKQIEGILQSYY